MVPAASHRIPRAPWYSGSPAPAFQLSPTGFSPSVMRLSSTLRLASRGFCQVLQPRRHPKVTPVWALSLSLAATPEIECLFLFLQVLRWFTSLSSLRRAYEFSSGWCRFPGPGSPIRTPPDRRSLAAPRGFSQLATSFIASLRQGIHRIPLVA